MPFSAEGANIMTLLLTQIKPIQNNKTSYKESYKSICYGHGHKHP